MRNFSVKKYFKSSFPPWLAFLNRLNIYAQFILLAYLAIWMECRLFEGMTGAFAFILFPICGAIFILNLMAYLRKHVGLYIALICVYGYGFLSCVIGLFRGNFEMPIFVTVGYLFACMVLFSASIRAVKAME